MRPGSSGAARRARVPPRTLSTDLYADPDVLAALRRHHVYLPGEADWQVTGPFQALAAGQMPGPTRWKVEPASCKRFHRLRTPVPETAGCGAGAAGAEAAVRIAGAGVDRLRWSSVDVDRDRAGR